METMTADELMKAFAESGLMAGAAAVEEIIRRDDVHEHLARIIKEDAYWERGGPGDAWSPYHAFIILGLKGDDKSFDILEYAVRNRVEELGDYITEDLPAVLYSFGQAYFDRIKVMAFDTSLDMFVRCAALSALCAFAVTGKKPADEVTAACMRFIETEENKELVALCLPDMAEIKDEKLFETVKAFHQKSREAKRVCTLDDLTELQAGTSSLKAYTHCTKNLREYFSEKNLKYLGKVAQSYENPPEEGDRAMPPQTAEKVKKTERNEPCPCGSGLKYKKCCWLADRGVAADGTARASRILQLKVTLDGVKPPVWRRLLVEDSVTFEKLHNILQAAMGWENYHLYGFQVDDTRIDGEEDNLCVDGMWKAFRPEQKTASPKTRLGKLIREEKQEFTYTYDFGDNWQHTLTVEKILERNISQKYPSCTAGERACPPEDCGGTWGYEELMEIRENKKHAEYHERIVEWLGEDYNPEHFNTEEVNKRLR